MNSIIIQAFKALEDIDDSVVVVKPKKKLEESKKSLKESQDDYYVISDGQNSRKSIVFSSIDNLDEFIDKLEKDKGDSYSELLHYVNGTPKKVWTSKEGKIGESCELKEEPVYGLEPHHDSRKSFYGKAHVDERPDGTKVLYSYNTPVCMIKDGKVTLGRAKMRGYDIAVWNYSPTTLRHVKEFLKQNGFEASSNKQMEKDYAIDFINESLKESKLHENELVDLSDKDEVEKAKEKIEKDEVKDENEYIVDVDAETIDKLKDSYVGDVVLICRKCRTPKYVHPEDVKKDEETEFYNLEDECSHCGATMGYELGGQIGEFSNDEQAKEASKDEDDKKDEKDDIEVEKKVTKIEDDENDFSKVESFDDERFNTLVTKYLKEVYSNVDSFETKDGSFEDNKVVLEGTIKYTNDKTKDVKFIFENISKTKGNKYRLVGTNEGLTKDKDAFSVICATKNNALICESFIYNYKVNLNEEETLIRGRTSLRESKKVKEEK